MNVTRSIKVILIAFLNTVACLAQHPPSVEPRKISLGAAHGDASIEVYEPLAASAHRTLVVIVPGGGFATLSGYDRLLAEFFRGQGYPAAVVNYRLLPATYPAAVQDVKRAIQILRAGNSTEMPVDRIALLGESAGGMIASIAAVEPEFVPLERNDLSSSLSSKPDLLMLISPVISATMEKRYHGLDRWLGKHTTERAKISPELHVSRDAPPALIFHAADDTVVPYEGSLAFAQAYWRAGASADLRIFPIGGHGHGFTFAPQVSRVWREEVLLWLSAHGSSDTLTSPEPQR